ncbi:putative kinesin K39 [Diplonema papillatum]|nr:putative kinesin K39 [Diplonema papillatum]
MPAPDDATAAPSWGTALKLLGTCRELLEENVLVANSVGESEGAQVVDRKLVNVLLQDLIDHTSMLRRHNHVLKHAVGLEEKHAEEARKYTNDYLPALMHHRVTYLQDQLAMVREAMVCTEGLLESVTQRTEQLSANTNDLAELLFDTDGSLEHVTKAVEEAMRMLEEAESGKGDVRSSSDTSSQRHANLFDMQQELTARAEVARALLREKKQLTVEREQLRAELQDTSNALSSLKEALEQNTTTVSTMEDEASERAGALQRHAAAAERLTAENSALRKQLQDLSTASADAGGAAAGAAGVRLAELEGEVAQLANELRAKTDAAGQLTEENASLKTQVRGLASSAETAHAAAVQSAEKLANLEAEISHLSADLDAKADSTDKLSAENDALRRQIEDLTSSSAATSGVAGRVAELEAGTKRLAAENDALRRRLEEEAASPSGGPASAGRVAELEAEIKRLSAENDTLRRRLEDATSSSAARPARVAELEAEVQRLSAASVENAGLRDPARERQQPAALEAEYARLTAASESLAAENAALRGQLSGGASAAQLSRDLAEKSEAVAMMEEAARGREAEKAELRAVIDDLRARLRGERSESLEVRELRDALADAQRERDALKAASNNAATRGGDEALVGMLIDVDRSVRGLEGMVDDIGSPSSPQPEATAQLEAELAALRAERDTLTGILSAVEDSLASFGSSVEQLAGERAAVSEENEHLASQLSDMSSTAAKTAVEVRDLREKLSAVATEQAKPPAESETAAVSRAVEASDREVARLQAAVASAESDRKRAEAQLQAREDRLVAVEAEAAELAAELAEAASREAAAAARLNDRISALTQQLADASREKTKATGQLAAGAESDEGRADLAARLATAEMRIETLLRDLSSAHDQRDRVASEADLAAAALTTRLRAAEAERNAIAGAPAPGDTAALHADLARARADLQDAEGALAAARREASDLTARLTAAESEVASLERAVDAATAAADAAEARLARAAADPSDPRALLHAAEARAAAAEAALAAAAAENSGLAAQLAAAQAEPGDASLLRRDLDRVKLERDGLLTILRQADSTLKHLESSVEALSGDPDMRGVDLGGELRSADARVDEVRGLLEGVGYGEGRGAVGRILGDLDGVVAELSESVARLAVDNEDLETQKEQLEEQLVEATHALDAAQGEIAEWVDKAGDEAETSSNELVALRAERQMLREILTDTDRMVFTLKTTIENLSEAVRAAGSENESLTSRLTEISLALDCASSEVGVLNNRLEEANARATIAEHQKTESLSQRTATEEREAAAKSRLLSAEASLAASEAAGSAAAARAGEAERRLEEAEGRVQAAETELAAWKAREAEARERRSADEDAYLAEIRAVTERNDTLQRVNEKASSEIVELKALLDEMGDSHQRSLDEAVSDPTADVLQALSDPENAVLQTDPPAVQLRKYARENAILRDALRSAREEAGCLPALRDEAARLQTELRRWEASHPAGTADLTSRVAALEAECEGLRAEHANHALLEARMSSITASEPSLADASTDRPELGWAPEAEVRCAELRDRAIAAEKEAGELRAALAQAQAAGEAALRRERAGWDGVVVALKGENAELKEKLDRAAGARERRSLGEKIHELAAEVRTLDSGSGGGSHGSSSSSAAAGPPMGFEADLDYAMSAYRQKREDRDEHVTTAEIHRAILRALESAWKNLTGGPALAKATEQLQAASNEWRAACEKAVEERNRLQKVNEKLARDVDALKGKDLLDEAVDALERGADLEEKNNELRAEVAFSRDMLDRTGTEREAAYRDLADGEKQKAAAAAALAGELQAELLDEQTRAAALRQKLEDLTFPGGHSRNPSCKTISFKGDDADGLRPSSRRESKAENVADECQVASSHSASRDTPSDALQTLKSQLDLEIRAHASAREEVLRLRSALQANWKMSEDPRHSLSLPREGSTGPGKRANDGDVVKAWRPASVVSDESRSEYSPPQSGQKPQHPPPAECGDPKHRRLQVVGGLLKEKVERAAAKEEALRGSLRAAEDSVFALKGVLAELRRDAAEARDNGKAAERRLEAERADFDGMLEEAAGRVDCLEKELAEEALKVDELQEAVLLDADDDGVRALGLLGDRLKRAEDEKRVLQERKLAAESLAAKRQRDVQLLQEWKRERLAGESAARERDTADFLEARADASRARDGFAAAEAELRAENADLLRLVFQLQEDSPPLPAPPPHSPEHRRHRTGSGAGCPESSAGGDSFSEASKFDEKASRMSRASSLAGVPFDGKSARHKSAQRPAETGDRQLARLREENAGLKARLAAVKQELQRERAAGSSKRASSRGYDGAASSLFQEPTATPSFSHRSPQPAPHSPLGHTLPQTTPLSLYSSAPPGTANPLTTNQSFSSHAPSAATLHPRQHPPSGIAPGKLHKELADLRAKYSNDLGRASVVISKLKEDLRRLAPSAGGSQVSSSASASGEGDGEVGRQQKQVAALRRRISALETLKDAAPARKREKGCQTARRRGAGGGVELSLLALRHTTEALRERIFKKWVLTTLRNGWRRVTDGLLWTDSVLSADRDDARAAALVRFKEPCGPRGSGRRVLAEQASIALGRLTVKDLLGRCFRRLAHYAGRWQPPPAHGAQRGPAAAGGASPWFSNAYDCYFEPPAELPGRERPQDIGQETGATVMSLTRKNLIFKRKLLNEVPRILGALHVGRLVVKCWILWRAYVFVKTDPEHAPHFKHLRSELLMARMRAGELEEQVSRNVTPTRGRSVSPSKRKLDEMASLLHKVAQELTNGEDESQCSPPPRFSVSPRCSRNGRCGVTPSHPPSMPSSRPVHTLQPSGGTGPIQVGPSFRAPVRVAYSPTYGVATPKWIR